MSLSYKQQLRINLKAVEFYLPLSFEKLAVRTVPSLSGDPWLLGERDMGVIFTHVPKSAGTSIVDAFFGQKSRHVPVMRYAAYDEQRFNQCFKFTFVRNPWSRLHSAYHYLYRKVGKGDKFLDWIWATHYLSNLHSFEQFVLSLKNNRFRIAIKRYVHFRDQLDWISIPRKGMAMDYVGRFETLEADFQSVCEALGKKDILLQRLRPGGGQDYRDAFTGEMVDVVADIYKKDIEVLGYGFDC